MYRSTFFGGICLIFTVGCGVKGDPRPPLHSANIGRGRPTYRRAMEEVVDPSIMKESLESEEQTEKLKNSTKGY